MKTIEQKQNEIIAEKDAEIKQLNQYLDDPIRQDIEQAIIDGVCEMLLSEEIAILADDAWVKHSGKKSNGFGAMQKALAEVVEKIRGEV